MVKKLKLVEVILAALLAARMSTYFIFSFNPENLVLLYFYLFFAIVYLIPFLGILYNKRWAYVWVMFVSLFDFFLVVGYSPNLLSIGFDLLLFYLSFKLYRK